MDEYKATGNEAVAETLALYSHYFFDYIAHLINYLPKHGLNSLAEFLSYILKILSATVLQHFETRINRTFFIPRP